MYSRKKVQEQKRVAKEIRSILERGRQNGRGRQVSLLGGKIWNVILLSTIREASLIRVENT